MICKPCGSATHWECEYPASCPCAHKNSVDGAADQWSYTPIPVVLEAGEHTWVWRVTHPEAPEQYYDRDGHTCVLSFGARGVVLLEQVDKSPKYGTLY